MKPSSHSLAYLRALLLLLLLPVSLVSWGRVIRQSPSARLPTKASVEQNSFGVRCMNRYAFKEAAAAFRRALAVDPSFNLARVNLGIALFYDQNLEEALGVLQAAEKNEPMNPYVHFVLGLIYRNRGENHQAEIEFSTVAKVDDSCPTNHYNLGLLFAREHRDKEAEAEFRRALELDPNSIPSMYNLGELLIKTGRLQEGNSFLDRFRTLSQKRIPSTGMGSGSQYGDMGKYAVARDYRPPESNRTP